MLDDKYSSFEMLLKLLKLWKRILTYFFIKIKIKTTPMW